MVEQQQCNEGTWCNNSDAMRLLLLQQSTETKSKTHHHPKIELQQCWQSKICSATLLPMPWLFLALLLADCCIEHFWFNQHQHSLSIKSCCNGTTGLCHAVAIFCLWWLSGTVALAVPCLFWLAGMIAVATGWLFSFNFFKIILLPANAGIAPTCTASVLYQPCIARNMTVLLLLLSLAVDCWYATKYIIWQQLCLEHSDAVAIKPAWLCCWLLLGVLISIAGLLLSVGCWWCCCQWHCSC